MARRKFWIGKAVKRPGALRARMRELHLMPKDAERIPRKALERAAAGAFGPKTRQRAALALKMRSFNH